MFQWFARIENIITLISILFIVISLASKFLAYIKRGRYIKGILMSQNPISISFPVRNNVRTETAVYPYSMITLEELIAAKKNYKHV